MTAAPRKLVLALHLAVSVGWIGAVAAYTALDVLVAVEDEPETLRGAYLAMDHIVRYVIVPLAVATLLTGIATSLGTRWGLFRHYWVVISLVLTTFATIVLLSETRVVGRLAEVAADQGTPVHHLAGLGNTLPHSIGGMAVLVVVLVLNVYKPRGLTAYGRRRARSDPDE